MLQRPPRSAAGPDRAGPASCHGSPAGWSMRPWCCSRSSSWPTGRCSRLDERAQLVTVTLPLADDAERSARRSSVLYRDRAVIAASAAQQRRAGRADGAMARRGQGRRPAVAGADRRPARSARRAGPGGAPGCAAARWSRARRSAPEPGPARSRRADRAPWCAPGAAGSWPSRCRRPCSRSPRSPRLSLRLCRDAVELLRCMGASPGYQAAQLERHALAAALLGGAGGFVLALLTVAALLYSSRRIAIADAIELGPAAARLGPARRHGGDQPAAGRGGRPGHGVSGSCNTAGELAFPAGLGLSPAAMSSRPLAQPRRPRRGPWLVARSAAVQPGGQRLDAGVGAGRRALPAAAAGGRSSPSAGSGWRGVQFLLRHLVGLDYEVRGRANMPPGPRDLCLQASVGVGDRGDPPAAAERGDRAQARADADPAVRLVPAPLGHDRHRPGGPDARAALADRRRPGRARARRLGDHLPRRHAASRRAEHVPYHPGVAALYLQLGRPVVPVALNSGLFWGRRSFVKRPGRIVVRVPGADRAGPRPQGVHGRAAGGGSRALPTG